MEERVKDFIHERLKGCKGVRQIERHDEELEVGVVSAEHRFHGVGRVHADLVISRTKIELGEETGTTQLIEKVLRHGGMGNLSLIVFSFKAW